jgi:hypothetical protein
MMERFHGSVQAGISHNSESSKRVEKYLKGNYLKKVSTCFKFPLAFQFFNNDSMFYTLRTSAQSELNAVF